MGVIRSISLVFVGGNEIANRKEKHSVQLRKKYY